MILETVLQNKAQAWDDTVVDYKVVPIRLHIPRVAGEDANVAQYTVSTGKIHIGNVNILLLCHQVCPEGSKILYGRNSFESYKFPQPKFRAACLLLSIVEI